MTEQTPEESKKEEQDKRQAAFIAEVDTLQEKYDIKIGVELTYQKNGIIPRLILVDTKGQPTPDGKETEATA